MSSSDAPYQAGDAAAPPQVEPNPSPSAEDAAKPSGTAGLAERVQLCDDGEGAPIARAFWAAFICCIGGCFVSAFL